MSDCIVYEEVVAEATTRVERDPAAAPAHAPEVYASILLLWLERWQPRMSVADALARARRERPPEFDALHAGYLEAHATARRRAMN